MYCTECGSRLTEGALFCTKCGAKVTVLEENGMSAALMEQKVTSADETVDSKIQKIRDCLMENVPECPKIKKIDVTNPQNKYGTNTSRLSVMITGFFS